MPEIIYSKEIREMFPTGSKRDRVREMIRIRDDHTCQHCGKKWTPQLQRFPVHHIDCDTDKTMECVDYELCKDNLITLCPRCHRLIPEHRKNSSESMKNKK